jgi:hypothetical protein
MAVYNDYVDAKILAGRQTSAISSQGSRAISGRVVFDTPICDAGSVLRVLKSVPASAVFKELNIFGDGVTGASDVDVCLYKNSPAGAQVGSELLASTLDLSGAVTQASPKNGLGNLTNSQRNQSLWEIASQTINSRGQFFDIGLRTVAAITEVDTLVVDYTYWAP